MGSEVFSMDMLELDCAKETERAIKIMREIVLKRFKKRGVVVALSGGIDSSVVGALCVRAFGKEHVLGLLMPEKDSSPDTLRLSSLIAEWLEVETVHEDITNILEAVGCPWQRCRLQVGSRIEIPYPSEEARNASLHGRNGRAPRFAE